MFAYNSLLAINEYGFNENGEKAIASQYISKCRIMQSIQNLIKENKSKSDKYDVVVAIPITAYRNIENKSLEQLGIEMDGVKYNIAKLEKLLNVHGKAKYVLLYMVEENGA